MPHRGLSKVSHLTNRFRDVFIPVVEAYGDSPLWLSGGVDSASILAAQLELGYKPRCYTYQIGDSVSRDSACAASMCKTFNLEHTLVKIPRTDAELHHSVKYLVPLCRKYTETIPDSLPVYKVFIQVAHGSIHILDRMYSLGDKKALCGFCADGYWGSGRRMGVLYRKDPQEWQAYREKWATHPLDSESFVFWLAKRRFTELVDIWADPSVKSFMLGLGYKEMHQKFLKSLAVRSFPEFWKQGSWYRPNESMQVVSGMREWHDTLLQGPLNTEGHKSIIGLYNRIH